MKAIEPEQILRSIPEYGETTQNIARGLHRAVLEGGQPIRKLADLLHGTWLGHPLHPLLTDLVIGAWSMGSLLDLLGNRSRRKGRAATRLIGVGNLVAIPTALAGITDFSTISRSVTATGATHGLLNALALVLNTVSYFNRKNGHRERGVFLSALAMGLLLVSGWLGGEMTYRYRVGVNKALQPKEPEDWQAVMDESELHEQKPRRVEVEGYPVLLYRYGGTVYAIGAVCSHDGGPLEEGNFDGHCVECPWHQSVFDLRDGSVVHGPSTYGQPLYNARIQDGKVEVRQVQTA